MMKDKSFSAINISGLALGMACSLLIVLWVLDEKGIDAFHANDSRLYMVYEQQHYDGIVNGSYATPGLLAEDLKQNYPEIEYSTGMAWTTSSTFEGQRKNFQGSWRLWLSRFLFNFQFSIAGWNKRNRTEDNNRYSHIEEVRRNFFRVG
ncbi:MAG TPA: ABC transporter permease [Chryseolinea sp.]